MGALLVTLLQCRSSQSLYPNVSATQARQVTYQQPCSVPLITHPAHGRRLSSPSPTEEEAAAVTTANCDEQNNSCRNLADSRESFHVSPGSSELATGPNENTRRPAVLEALKRLSKNIHSSSNHNANTNNNEGGGIDHTADEAAGKDGNNVVHEQATAEAAELAVMARKHAVEQQQQEEEEELRRRLTRPPRIPAASNEGQQAGNAIYRFTFPGAPSTTPASAPLPSLTDPPITSTTAALMNTPPRKGTDTQQGDREDSLLELSRRHSQHSGTAVADALYHSGSAEDQATPLSLTPLRPMLSDRAASNGSYSSNNNVLRERHRLHHHRDTLLVDLADADDGQRKHVHAPTAEEKKLSSRKRDEGVEDAAAAELGPMDCADAFQYFYDDDDAAYRAVESVVYAAPSTALRATGQDAVRDWYLLQCTALFGGGAGPSLTVRESSPDVRGDGQRLLCAASPLGAPASLRNPQTEYLLGSLNNTTNTGINRSLCFEDVEPIGSSAQPEGSTRARSCFFEVAAAAEASTAGSPCHVEHPPNGAGRFVSLVEEMYVTCRRIGNAPLVCWRSVDRITSLLGLPEASRGFFGLRIGTSTAALQNARGEAEDDESHLPGVSAADDEAADADGAAATMASTSPRRSAARFVKSGSHEDTKREASTRSEAARAASLYYLGPQQYLTGSVWWSRVEAFSCGLRSIGLRPGNFLGIVEDTRWEWLVTCYAAWNSGLVVVVFDDAHRTLRRVAMDTCGEMKAVVCNPQVHHRLRRHFAHAAMRAARHAQQEQRHANTRSSDIISEMNGSVATDDGGSSHRNTHEDDRSGQKCAAAAADVELENACLHNSDAATSASTNTSAHEQIQLKHASPLFIVVRSAAPARDGADGGGQKKPKRHGRSAHRTDDGVSHAAAPTAPFSSATTCDVPRPSQQGPSAGHPSPPHSHSHRHAQRRRASDFIEGPQHRDTAEARRHTRDDDSGEDEVEIAEDEEEEEEEEALWWSDILSYGEAKLSAWRQRQARERRQRQQKQARLRFQQQQQQQQRQRWARNETTASMNSSTHDSSSTATLRRQPGGTPANSTTGGAGSRDGSAIVTSITAPTHGWAAVTTCTTATTTAATASANASAGMTSASTAPTTACQQLDAVGGGGGGGEVVGFVPASSATPQGGPPAQRPATGVATAAAVATVFNVTHPVASPYLGPNPTTAATAPPGQHSSSSSSGNNYTSRPAQLPLAPLRPDDLAFVFYTAGEPKGVLLTHGALKASMAAQQEYFDTTDIGVDDGLRRGREGGGHLGSVDSKNGGNGGGGGTDNGNGSGEGRLARYYANARMPALRSRTAPAGRPSYLAYLPMHHISEFIAQATLLTRGVLVCYGTRRTLFDAFALPHGDLTEYKPTIFPALPATLARLHRAVQAMLSTGYRKLLFEVAYEARRQAIRRGLQSPFVLSTIFAQPRELLGGRCRLVLSREAPLHPRDQEYLEVVCGVSVVQQYGPAETAGSGLQQAYCAGHLDTIGGPLGPVLVKLRDVAGGWTHQGGRPTGELVLRGPTVMAGYYRQPELTAEVLEKNGWFHSSMVAERCPDGAFRLVASLRPHHACTSNGQCIDLEQLEARYASHPLCTPGGVCLLVHPYRRYICALVLTNERRARAFAAAATAQSPFAFSPSSTSSPATTTTTITTTTAVSPPQQLAAAAAASLSSLSSPCAPTSPFAALASAAAEHGWWPQCLRDPALHSAAAQSLVAWVTDPHGGGGGDGGVAPHERVRHVRVLYDVWDTARHTRTATGRLFRYGLHCRYSGVICELFAEPD
ncbi:putative long-chain-fatty-acid-CoA ligase [Leptomonas pyrrhocoris]|uniref:Putative long-chain-fatty-acid-CoA ligase n=1 Tax=Leptomonas pyrrhocoris TaxID=157538 RepID=A0A0M9FQC7_LEPPY|nr:putative long-chain-fatty-acid-CoA ligase [Leptomonas pyrrhocoris]XP_015652166.1 putative long-chain-fatty-acid-CoA ligase [Leptomonas pyrrhocoris]KPA73726.1 putative long-chain-fatty-acid-CoA ligase [Leptomonas pyrrhocoris]KPA73727.1 putative long-chain-fatty-acid-CoA ligase [Leptomonas pyrrhocoris]|eukprot:XP_015652165.1 putative long-chain-fatty-acid-CoA ligase [Leptomonas pyrrhocoris]